MPDSAVPPTLKEVARRRPPVVFPGLDHAGRFGTSLAVVIAGAPGCPLLRRSPAGHGHLHAAANMLSDVFDFKRGWTPKSPR